MNRVFRDGYYLCVVVFIKDPLNYDIILPNNRDVVESISDMNDREYQGKECTICRIDPSTYERMEDEVHDTLRVRLGGIELINDKNVKSINAVSFLLRRWNNMCCSIFICHMNCIDKYGRIIAELYDPVTGTPISQFLVNSYPDLYRKYRHSV